MFNGFTPAAIDFLWGIRFNNNRDWFQAHKAEYQRDLYQPMLALADAVRETIGETSNGILLANHGMAACGHSLKNAYGIALAMEWCAELQWRCMCAGAPHYLSAKQMEGVMKRYETYGQVRPDGTKPHGYSG